MAVSDRFYCTCNYTLLKLELSGRSLATFRERSKFSIPIFNLYIKSSLLVEKREERARIGRLLPQLEPCLPLFDFVQLSHSACFPGSGDYYCSGNDLGNFMNIPPDGIAAMAEDGGRIL